MFLRTLKKLTFLCISLSCSYILKVPLDKEAESSIIYVWLGSKAEPDELRLVEEIAEEMFNNVRATFPFSCSFLSRSLSFASTYYTLFFSLI